VKWLRPFYEGLTGIGPISRVRYEASILGSERQVADRYRPMSHTAALPGVIHTFHLTAVALAGGRSAGKQNEKVCTNSL
jgi:hypothetical protein